MEEAMGSDTEVEVLDLTEKTPSDVLAELLPAIRQRLGFSAAGFAERARAVGLRFDRGTVSKIENGLRGVSLDEALAIAVALDVAPVHLFLPREDKADVLIAPNLSVRATTAREWFRGQTTPPGGDDQTYRTEVPKSEWTKRSRQLQIADERVERAVRRHRVAKEKLAILSDRLGQLDAAIAEQNAFERASSMTLFKSTPEQEERNRLSRLYDTTLQEVAEAAIDVDEAKDDRRLVRAEQGDDGSA